MLVFNKIYPTLPDTLLFNLVFIDFRAEQFERARAKEKIKSQSNLKKVTKLSDFVKVHNS